MRAPREGWAAPPAPSWAVRCRRGSPRPGQLTPRLPGPARGVIRKPGGLPVRIWRARASLAMLQAMASPASGHVSLPGPWRSAYRPRSSPRWNRSLQGSCLTSPASPHAQPLGRTSRTASATSPMASPDPQASSQQSGEAEAPRSPGSSPTLGTYGSQEGERNKEAHLGTEGPRAPRRWWEGLRTGEPPAPAAQAPSSKHPGATHLVSRLLLVVHPSSASVAEDGAQQGSGALLGWAQWAQARWGLPGGRKLRTLHGKAWK